MERCPYNEHLTDCTLPECILVKILPEDGVDSFFCFLEIFKKEKMEIYNQLQKNCRFFEATVEEILNSEVRQTHEEIYS